MNRILEAAALAALTAGLSACGGGGGSAGTPSQPTTVNAAMAWQNLLTLPHSWTLSGTGNDGNTYQLALTLASAGTTTFPVNGVSATGSNTTTVLSQNGTTIASGVDETYFDTGYRVIGDRTSVSGFATTCTLTTQGSSAVPPASANVGASGPLVSSSDLDSCAANATVTGNGTTTWEIQQVSGVLYFCTKSVDLDNTSNVTTTETDCVETDANGNLGSSATVTVVYSTGLTINLSN